MKMTCFNNAFGKIDSTARIAACSKAIQRNVVHMT